MPVTRCPARFSRIAALALTGIAFCLVCNVAQAEESELEPDSKAPRARADGSPDSLAVSGLVPLAELNRLPYSGLWFFDGRFHNLGAGFVVTRLSVAGSAQTSQMTTQNVSEKLDYYGFFGDYYVPLLGYSPELSVGLLPVLKLEAGGFFDTTNNALSDRTEAELGILVELPVFAMARIGRRASRVGAWDLSVGAGVGLSLIHFSAGGPIVSSPSYLAPALRLEVAYKVFQLAYESALSSHDESFGGADHLRYQSHSIMIGAFFQPEVDD